LERSLDFARFVSVDQGCHTVYLLTPNLCGNQIATAFLAEGILPNRDVSCPADTMRRVRWW
jgi:hypothetical protein